MSGAYKPTQPSMVVEVTPPPPEPDVPYLEENSPEQIEGTSQPTAPVTPHNIEAERVTVGSVLLNPERWLELAAILKPADFYIRRHGWIWVAFENLITAGELIEVLSVSDELKKMGKLEEVGGLEHLTALQDDCPLGLHAATYARKVKDASILRSLAAAAGEIATLAYARDANAEKVSARALEAVQESASCNQVRYTVHNAADALAPRDPVEWIVKGFIYKKCILVVYGDGGTKKTWFSAFVSACVSGGVACGDFETKKCRVLFIDEENGDDEISDRLGRCLRGALVDETADLRYISLAAFHLDNPQDEAMLMAEIKAQEAGLVVLDALADLMIGDENSKQDTQPVFNALRRIAEKTGAAILVIHHANKNGGHRGSSVIKDAPDILLQVSSDPDSNFINFKTEKNRKGKALKWSMRATWSQDSFYLTNAETQEKTKTLSKSQDYVIRYLTEHGASELPAIEGAADVCSGNAARQAVYALVPIGKVYRTNPGGKPAIYDLSKESV
jgi:hypothetical protein